MKPITPGEYDAVVDEWKAWQSYPWGRLLYTLLRANLARHTGSRPLRILDVGGGNGFNSIYYAQQGQPVTLLDYSPAMLDEARKNALEAGVLEKITFCQADAKAVLDVLPGQQFDLILCHLMIEFVPEPVQVLKDICSRLAPGGLLSVVDANRFSDVYRKAFMANDLAAAAELIGTREYLHPWFNRITPLFSRAEMIENLRAGGTEAVGDYGILCLCAYLPNEPKYEPEYYHALEQLELKLTDTYPYNLLARFYQVIVRKT